MGRSVKLVLHMSIGGRSATSTRHSVRGSFGAGSLVDAHHDRVKLGLELLLLLLDGLSVSGVALQELEALISGGFDSSLVLLSQVSLELLLIESVLHLVAVVLSLDLLADDIISSPELLSISDKLLDFLLGEAALVVGDGDLLSLAGGLVGRHIEDTIGVNIEGNLDLRGATRRRRDAFKVELAEEMVVLGHLTLALVDLDKDTRLFVSVGREGLRLLGRNARVAGDQVSHDTASSLNTLRERSYVEEND